MPADNSPTAPSARPGMGTILYPGGVAFRVWSPFASGVFATGTFNQWNATANPFASEGNYYWSVDVPGAKIGDEYQFVIHNGAQVLWHKNPYASEVVNSSGNAIIHDPTFDWTGDTFVMPPWNELVIYEMHVGTFNDAPGVGPGTFDEVIPKLARRTECLSRRTWVWGLTRSSSCRRKAEKRRCCSTRRTGASQYRTSAPDTDIVPTVASMRARAAQSLKVHFREACPGGAWAARNPAGQHDPISDRRPAALPSKSFSGVHARQPKCVPNDALESGDHATDGRRPEFGGRAMRLKRTQIVEERAQGRT
jgi:hypothetical protein